MSVPLIVWEKWKDPLLTQLGNSDTQNDEEDEYEEPDKMFVIIRNQMGVKRSSVNQSAHKHARNI